ncbi:hypothetical protein LAZ67_1001173 [Cordylochernes scorpioides]|uniref:Uncharacterized protein n=1 Tax=Cordylochernes scorpioides TaxID=51811 RepID=A0ABY6JV84_9ARAC|nr:hypothetical protein LAZ67_1001173 [Cordylochernes scorpioides]
MSAGFLFGLSCGYFSDSWGQGAWPTAEMTSRGLLRSLWVGALIALPSGAGVALSILGGNAGSLVGVAISASLLPPLVNAMNVYPSERLTPCVMQGLLWALAAIKFWKSMGEEATAKYRINGGDNGVVQISGPPNPDYLKPSLAAPKGYHPVFSDSMDVECGVLGVVSLGLTLVNIVCIVLMAVAVLKVSLSASHT